MNYTTITLGELLSSPDETIKRNAISILKRLQNGTLEKIHPNLNWSTKKAHQMCTVDTWDTTCKGCKICNRKLEQD